MTEEKLVERVTALFADSDAAQRKMIRLYAETNDAIEASAIIDSGAEVLHMLQGGRVLYSGAECHGTGCISGCTAGRKSSGFMCGTGGQKYTDGGSDAGKGTSYQQ